MQQNKVIDRKLDKQLEKELKFMGRTLDKLVDYSETMMEKLQTQYGSDELNTPIFTQFMHLVHMADSISLMVKKGSSDGVIPLCRSMFESSLYFEYLITSPKEKGVIAYQVSHANKRLKERELIDESTEKGREIRQKVKEEFDGNLPNYSYEQYTQPLRDFLNRKDISPVNEEYNNQKKKEPNWFSLFSNSQNIRELASELKKESIYVLLYKQWSDTVHGGNTIGMIRANEKQGVLPGIRNPEQLPELTNITLTLLGEAFFLIDKLGYAEWYYKELKQAHDRIINTNITMEYNT